MIYSGSDLKFKVEANIQGFSMVDNDFVIVIKNRWGQHRCTIKKEECFQDENNGFYFTIENVSIGVFYAYFTAYLPDDDYDKQIRNVVDKQRLYTVDSCGCKVNVDDCTCDSSCPCHDGEMKVTYKQVWTVNLDDGTYLTDKNGDLILTDDDMRIKVK